MYTARISDAEFAQRAKNVQELMQQEGIDLLLSYGNEAEPQFLRYLCDYWPSFEAGAVLLAQKGDPLLLIGPESLTYAADRSRVKEIRRLKAFRESSNPDYPGVKLDTFNSVFDEVLPGVAPKKIGIAGYNLIPMVTGDELKESLQGYGGVQLVSADNLLMKLRMIKSEDEIACLKVAGEIAREAMQFTIDNIELGMTETQARGLGTRRMFELGCEDVAYPFWVLSGHGSDQAISRPRQKIIEPGLTHLGIGVRYEGYVATIGRQVLFGKVEDRLMDAIKAGYEAHAVISEQLYDGNNAGAVAKAYFDNTKKNGFYDWTLYGPCHATGLMEGEPPWIEEDSTYTIHKNMCYCIDVFLGQGGYGLRVEDSVMVGDKAAESFTNFPKEIFQK